jgi:hypothetical protein
MRIYFYLRFRPLFGLIVAQFSATAVRAAMS